MNTNNGKAITEKVALRPNSKRNKLLNVLIENKNKAVPIEQLAKKVYGSARRTAPLYMVAIGLASRLQNEHTGYRLTRQKVEGKVLYGLFSRRRRQE